MYAIRVEYPGAQFAKECIELQSAAAVLEIIPRLVKYHPDCVQLVVMHHAMELFRVSCGGEKITMRAV